MRPSEAASVVQLLLAAYPTQRQRMSDEDVRGMLAAYAAGLADLDAHATREGVNRIVKSARFIPSIAEIRDAVVQVSTGDRKTGGEAWGDAQALISRYGSHRTPGADFAIADHVLERTVRAFGWVNLCAGDGPDGGRSRFIELYDQLAKRARTETAIAPGARLDAPVRKQLPAPPAQLPMLAVSDRLRFWRDTLAEMGIS